jgi:hypothetical protein
MLWQVTNVSEDLTASVFRVKMEGSMVLRNVGNLPHYTASQPRRPGLEI